MSNENVKNKLVNSMKLTKAGTAKTVTATEKKQPPASTKKKVAKKAAPRKKTASTTAGTGFSSGACRVWPD